MNAMQIGLAFLPVALAIGTLSVDIRPAVCRFGARAVLLVGFDVHAGRLALFARAPLDADYVRGHPAGNAVDRRRWRTFVSSAHDGWLCRVVSMEDAGLASGLWATALRSARAGPGVLATISTARSQDCSLLCKPRFGADQQLPPGVRHQCRSGPVQHCGCRDDITRRPTVYAGGSRRGIRRPGGK